MLLKLLISFILICGLPRSTSAQSLVFQDPQQFIWRVEGSSLHRFDGYAWRTFSPNDGLPNVPIQSTFFDSQKRLWLFGAHTSTLVYLDSAHFIHSAINNIGVNDFSISTAWESGDSLFFKDQKTGSLLFLEKNKMALQRFYGQKSTPQYKAQKLPLTDCSFDEKTKTIQPKPLAWTSVLNESLKMACVLDKEKWLLATTDNALFVFEKNKPKRRILLIMNKLPEFKNNKLSITSLTVVGDFVFIGCTEGAFFIPKNAFSEGNVSLNAADFNITNTLVQRLNLTDNYLRIGKIHQIMPSTSARLQTLSITHIFLADV